MKLLRRRAPVTSCRRAAVYAFRSSVLLHPLHTSRNGIPIDGPPLDEVQVAVEPEELGRRVFAVLNAGSDGLDDPRPGVIAAFRDRVARQAGASGFEELVAEGGAYVAVEHEGDIVRVYPTANNVIAFTFVGAGAELASPTPDELGYAVLDALGRSGAHIP